MNKVKIKGVKGSHCIPRLSAGRELLISELGFDAEQIRAAILVVENFDKVTKNLVLSA